MRPRGSPYPLAAAVVAVALSEGACVAAGTTGPAVAGPDRVGSLLGNPAPDFSIATVGGIQELLAR